MNQRLRRRHLARALVAALWILTPGWAGAVDLSQSLEIGGFGLYTAYDLTDGSDLYVYDEFGGGFNVGYHFTNNVEAEFEFTYTSTEGCIGRCYAGNVLSTLINLNYNFHPHAQVVPFFKVGGGYVRIDNDYFGLLDDGGAVNVGGGLRWFPFAEGAIRGFNLRAEAEAVGVFMTDSTLNIKTNFGLGWGFNVGGGGKSSF